jgi:hypothetical protein
MPITRRLSRTFHFARLPTSIELAPVMLVPGAFHDAPRALAIRSRSLQWVFSTATGVTSNDCFERPTFDAPVALLIFPPRSRDSEIQLGRDRFSHPLREERAASTTRDVFHRDDAERPAMLLRAPVLRVDDSAILPPRLAVRHPFARRGLPLWASSRSPASSSNASFFERDVVVRLLQHDTKCRLTAR